MEEVREDERVLAEDPVGGQLSTPSSDAQQVPPDGFGGTPAPAREEGAVLPDTAFGAAMALLPAFAPRGRVGRVVARADALLQVADRLIEEMS
jgi:hypothetical protein